jgi:hypothetical protein
MVAVSLARIADAALRDKITAALRRWSGAREVRWHSTKPIIRVGVSGDTDAPPYQYLVLELAKPPVAKLR